MRGSEPSRKGSRARAAWRAFAILPGLVLLTWISAGGLARAQG